MVQQAIYPRTQTDFIWISTTISSGVVGVGFFFGGGGSVGPRHLEGGDGELLYGIAVNGIEVFHPRA